MTDELRDDLVPLNRKYPIAELMQACRDYPGVHNARRITFEYVMLKGVNDIPTRCARPGRAAASDVPAKVNLIPFNPWPGAPFECSTNRTASATSPTSSSAGGYASPVRTPARPGHPRRLRPAEVGQHQATPQRDPRRGAGGMRLAEARPPQPA